MTQIQNRIGCFGNLENGILDLFGICLPAGRQGDWDLGF
jgi:hypothetical protein